MKKKALLFVLILLVPLLCAGCGNSIVGNAYRSEDGDATLVFDLMLSTDRVGCYLTEYDVYFVKCFISSENQLTWGDTQYAYTLSDDGKVLTLGENRFEKTSYSLSMRWRVVKACCETYIGQYGIVGWLFSYLYQTYSEIGRIAMFCAALIDLCILGLVSFVLIKLSKRGQNNNVKKKPKRK